LSITSNPLFYKYRKLRESFTIFGVAAVHVAPAFASALNSIFEARTTLCLTVPLCTLTRTPFLGARLTSHFFVYLLYRHLGYIVFIVGVLYDGIAYPSKFWRDSCVFVHLVQNCVVVMGNPKKLLVSGMTQKAILSSR